MNWFDVMRRFENEDPMAFDQLCSLVRGKLSRMRHRGSFEQDEDVVQETLACLLGAWRRGGIREERCFEGFVRTLAERRRSDAWHRHVRPGAPDLVGDLDLAVEADDPLEEERRTCALDLDRAIRRLDDAQQCALRAIYLEGRTYLEASERLGLPLGTFKRKLCDGLKRMRSELRSCDRP